ncbi:Hypothetical predicted protein [Octopus vulgaris]|uniref:Uncharacterized protein n=1 Tax=Octopus vulgaris TaxID=6645 RepID=A0AA36FFH2_OCTVU|nr:Hypothetical predicted protein [Octopus vulgaris]
MLRWGTPTGLTPAHHQRGQPRLAFSLRTNGFYQPFHGILEHRNSHQVRNHGSSSVNGYFAVANSSQNGKICAKTCT